jgi:hypothetical protein
MILDPIFVVPWFVVAAIALTLGVRRAAKDGSAQGLKTVAITIGVGAVVLAALWLAFLIGYYWSGGH